MNKGETEREENKENKKEKREMGPKLENWTKKVEYGEGTTEKGAETEELEKEIKNEKKKALQRAIKGME